MIKEISSLQNSFIKNTAELKLKKNRQDRHEFIVEGIRAVEEALKAGWDVKGVLFTDTALGNKRIKELVEDIKDSTDCYQITDAIEKKLSDTDNPQGIMAILQEERYTLNNLVNKDGIILVLDEIRDPGNVGTIIRSSDAAGAVGVIILENSVDLYSPKVIRSTMGSIFHLPVIVGVSKEALEDWCQKNKVALWASALQGGKNMREITWPIKVALVMGNEAHGVSLDLLQKVQEKVYIPMSGKAESLNVGVATGILLFEGKYRQGLR